MTKPKDTPPNAAANSKMPSPVQQWHTVEEVARRYHRNRHVIRGWLRTGFLPGKRIGGRWLVSDAHLAAFEAKL